MASHEPSNDPSDDAGRRDVDARFLLAAERTLLAWVRTGVALQAAAIGIFQLADRLTGRDLIALSLLVVGTACHATGWWRWRAAEAAMRRGELPERGHAMDALAIALIVISFVMIVSLLAGG